MTKMLYIVACVSIHFWFQTAISEISVSLINNIYNSTKPILVQRDGQVYFLCTNTDQRRESRVVCRQLGYIGGWQVTLPKPENHSMGFNIACTGEEATLSECRYKLDIDNEPSECAGVLAVLCYNQSIARLVDSPLVRPNIGRLQIQYDDVPTDVCFEGGVSDESWNSTLNNNLEVLCAQLGYPGSLMTSSIVVQRNTSSLANIYTEDYKCRPNMALGVRLHKCLPDLPAEGYCNNDMYVHAVCAIPGYLGCYSVAVDSTETHDNMTVKRCITMCRQHGTHNAILFDGNKCTCRNGVFRDIGRIQDSECNVPCAGDPYDICGGSGNRISVYYVTLQACDDPKVPSNGSIIVYNNHATDEAFEFGAVVHFNCDEGFVLVGLSTMQCVLGVAADGLVWSGPTPMCQASSHISTATSITPTPKNITPIPPSQVTGINFILVIILIIVASVVIVIVIICVCVRSRAKFCHRRAIQNGKQPRVHGHPGRVSPQPNRNNNDQVPLKSLTTSPDTFLAADNYIGLDSQTRQEEQAYQGLTDPNALIAADNYMGLDSQTRQEEQAYQGLTDPIALIAADNYMGLDSQTRQGEQVYQGLTDPNALIAADNYMGLDSHTRQQEQAYEGLTDPKALMAADNYMGLDGHTRQQEQAYEGLTDPKALMAADNYMGLDGKTRQEEQTYEDLTNPGALNNEEGEESAENHEYQDPNQDPEYINRDVRNDGNKTFIPDEATKISAPENKVPVFHDGSIDANTDQKIHEYQNPISAV